MAAALIEFKSTRVCCCAVVNLFHHVADVLHLLHETLSRPVAFSHFHVLALHWRHWDFRKLRFSLFQFFRRECKIFLMLGDEVWNWFGMRYEQEGLLKRVLVVCVISWDRTCSSGMSPDAWPHLHAHGHRCICLSYGSLGWTLDSLTIRQWCWLRWTEDIVGGDEMLLADHCWPIHRRHMQSCL